MMITRLQRGQAAAEIEPEKKKKRVDTTPRGASLIDNVKLPMYKTTGHKKGWPDTPARIIYIGAVPVAEIELRPGQFLVTIASRQGNGPTKFNNEQDAMSFIGSELARTPLSWEL